MVSDFLDKIIFALQHIAFMGAVGSIIYIIIRILQQGIVPSSLLSDPFIPYILLTIPLYIVLVLLHVLGGRIGVFSAYMISMSFSSCVAYELRQDLTHPIYTVTEFIDSFSESSAWFRVHAVANFVFWSIIFLAFLYVELALLGVVPKVF